MKSKTLQPAYSRITGTDNITAQATTYEIKVKSNCIEPIMR